MSPRLIIWGFSSVCDLCVFLYITACVTQQRAQLLPSSCKSRGSVVGRPSISPSFHFPHKHNPLMFWVHYFDITNGQWPHCSEKSIKLPPHPSHLHLRKEGKDVLRIHGNGKEKYWRISFYCLWFLGLKCRIKKGKNWLKPIKISEIC